MLVSLLHERAVPFETLHARYGGLLELVRTLIGVVPNCDPYLEIWPPAFRTYNLLVPNFLNLPFLVWGIGAPRDLVGLAMYVSSREADCAYCSAHTCTFAIRRGAAPETVAHALDADPASLGARERAVIAAARAVSAVPSTFTPAHREAVEAAVSKEYAEWIGFSVAMMGFLNKFMDGIGVELEASTVREVEPIIGASGWSPGKVAVVGDIPEGHGPPKADGIGTKLGVFRHAPGALWLDRQWTAGVPDRWPAVGVWLRERTGHDFPVLSRLTQGRAIRAIATVLRDNLDATTSVVGVPRKLSAGLQYARAVGNPGLEASMLSLGVPESDPDVDALAAAVSTSPAQVDEALITRCRALSPEAIVEVVAFVAVLQMLHRLDVWSAR